MVLWFRQEKCLSFFFSFSFFCVGVDHSGDRKRHRPVADPLPLNVWCGFLFQAILVRSRFTVSRHTLRGTTGTSVSLCVIFDGPISVYGGHVKSILLSVKKRIFGTRLSPVVAVEGKIRFCLTGPARKIWYSGSNSSLCSPCLINTGNCEQSLYLVWNFPNSSPIKRTVVVLWNTYTSKAWRKKQKKWHWQLSRGKMWVTAQAINYLFSLKKKEKRFLNPFHADALL